MLCGNPGQGPTVTPPTTRVQRGGRRGGENHRMSRLLEGRRALVTGAASGIGRATALRMAQKGARVALVDVDEKGAAEATEEIRADGGSAIAIRADVSDEAEVLGAVSAAVER